MILFLLLYAFQSSARSLESVYLDKLKAAHGPAAVIAVRREFGAIQLAAKSLRSAIESRS